MILKNCFNYFQKCTKVQITKYYPPDIEVTKSTLVSLLFCCYSMILLFLGRLASYKYFNMDQAILNALELFDGLVSNGKLKRKE